jgi:hypothetical protein
MALRHLAVDARLGGEVLPICHARRRCGEIGSETGSTVEFIQFNAFGGA